MMLSFRLRIFAATTAHPLRTKANKHVATAADTRLYLAECLCACAACKGKNSELLDKETKQSFRRKNVESQGDHLLQGICINRVRNKKKNSYG